jgi:hypothetical protein
LHPRNRTEKVATDAGTVSIPVDDSEADEEADVATPDVEVSQTLPLPAGNLSNFDDRWGWIENDMLPRYQELLQDPAATRGLVSSDVAGRAADFRKLPDLPYPGG